MAATKFFAPEQLRVFDKLPADEVNTRIDESFVPKAVPLPPPSSPAEGRRRQVEYVQALREKVFAGWPESSAIRTELTGRSDNAGVRVRRFAFQSQPEVRCWLLIVQDRKVKRPEKLVLTVLDGASWSNAPAKWLWLGEATLEGCADLRREMQAEKATLAFFAPRGIEPAGKPGNARTATNIRRRYMLLGQTLDGMRVWDIRCAAQAVRALPEFRETPLYVRAQGEMGVNAAYAALFEPQIQKLKLERLPKSHAEGPDYLNVLRVGDIPQVLDLLGERVELISY